MKINSFLCFRRPISFLLFFIALIFCDINFLNSEESYFEEMKIDSTTKFDEKSSDLPTNPFEIVEKIRRANSLSDATEPSDAIDDALKSFNMINYEKEI